jgi:transposase
MVWVDEAAFYLLPASCKTYAPCGETPHVSVPLTRDHLSAISAISQDARLFFQVYDHPISTTEVITFLQLFRRTIRGHLTVIWDGAPIHHSHALKAWLAKGAAHHIHLERLPAYAPELNADEGVWNLLKYSLLANCCFPHLAALKRALLRAKDRLRHRLSALQGCLAHIGYS